MDIEQKKLLFRLTPESIDFLRGFKGQLMELLDEVLDDFHRIMLSNSQLGALLGDTDIDSHKARQKQHWERIFDGNFNDDYFECCKRIGAGHFSINLDQVSFISSYNFVIQRMRKSILCLDDTEENNLKLFNLVQSVLMLDMGFILSEYASSRKYAGEVEASKNFSNDMIDNTINISMAINETAIVSADMVHAIRKVDENSQRIAAAIEETVASMNSINQSTREAAVTASETRNMAENGATVVEKAYQQTEQITESVLGSVSQVEKLAEASKNIGDIVSQIEAIAGQTNLLALNATIEAARAGDAGRGFAVVASEVKTLSTQTAQATVDIKNRIQSLIREMDNIVVSMQTAKTDVEDGRKIMNTVKDHMSDIGGNIDRMNHLMEEISSVLGEQEHATGEISHGTSTIAEESGKNSNGIMEVVNAMKQVVSLVGQQIEALATHEIPNKVIRIAKSDHIIWKKRLVDMMVGMESLRSDELADHHNCRLGKWYYGEESLPYRDHVAFKALENCHRAVHDHGIQAVKDYEDGNIGEAMTQITNVEHASEEVVKNLDDLITAFSA